VVIDQRGDGEQQLTLRVEQMPLRSRRVRTYPFVTARRR